MPPPRVLIVLDTSGAWSRGILRGFAQLSREHAWVLLHYPPGIDLAGVVDDESVSAVVLGPAAVGPWPARWSNAVSVAVNVDRSGEGIASVCIDEERIADLALAHLLARGLRNVASFRFDAAAFGAVRERRFCEAATHAGVSVEPGWWLDAALPPRTEERAPALAAWLAGLRKPCGVFAGCDSWAHIVARHARLGGYRVPEDIAIVGVDNDLLKCEMTAPPLSSVAVPWRSVGEQAARLVRDGLRGKPIAGRRLVIEPTEVVSRRSSDTFAVDDPLVETALAWIHQHLLYPLTVPVVARAVGTTRQRLERLFRRALGRTVMQETRRARVELARRLLSSTNYPLPEVAQRSGFTSASLLSIAFRTETGLPPGAYRRRARGDSGTWES